MQDPGVFPNDYASARSAFQRAASQLAMTLEEHPVEGYGPAGEPLATSVAILNRSNSNRVLVLSSGLHGVEGFFGSAVQIECLRRWTQHATPSVNVVLLHALNPYGFAWCRRFDDQNVDLNRNFLQDSESYSGSPPGYARLDTLLNPKRPPSRWEAFQLKALAQIARYGMPVLKQAVAAGQYEFPQGLFFGGHRPSATVRMLDENLPRWLNGCESAVHLDFHTGLGPYATYKLLLDYEPSHEQRDRMVKWFGERSIEHSDAKGIAYEARGGLGQWCISRNFVPNYHFACAEFGTYSPLKVLSGLRTENQAHHWGDESSRRIAQRRLASLFCPRDRRWRSMVLDQSTELVDQAINGLASD